MIRANAAERFEVSPSPLEHCGALIRQRAGQLRNLLFQRARLVTTGNFSLYDRINLSTLTASQEELLVLLEQLADELAAVICGYFPRMAIHRLRVLRVCNIKINTSGLTGYLRECQRTLLLAKGFERLMGWGWQKTVKQLPLPSPVLNYTGKCVKQGKLGLSLCGINTGTLEKTMQAELVRKLEGLARNIEHQIIITLEQRVAALVAELESGHTGVRAGQAKVDKLIVTSENQAIPVAV